MRKKLNFALGIFPEREEAPGRFCKVDNLRIADKFDKEKQADNSNLVVSVVCHLVTSAVAPVLPVVTVVSVVSVVSVVF